MILIGTWIGLIAGFGDVGFLVMNKQFIFRDFYHLGADFPWIVPSGVTVMVLVPALLIALFARIRGSVRLGVPVLLLSLVGFLDLCARLRLELWATVIISIAMAVQSVRLARPRRRGFCGLCGWTVGWLMAILVGTMFVSLGGRVWSEYRQQATLPPAAAGAQSVLLVVWDTVRAANTSLHGYGRPTTPNLERLATPRSAVRAGVLDVVLDSAFTCKYIHWAMASRVRRRLEGAGAGRCADARGVTWLRTGMIRRGSWRISIIAAGRQGWLAGLLITKIFR